MKNNLNTTLVIITLTSKTKCLDNILTCNTLDKTLQKFAFVKKKTFILINLNS